MNGPPPKSTLDRSSSASDVYKNPVLQGPGDAEGATRLLLARELTIEEKREFVDLRIEGWLRSLPEALARELRREWARLRELGKNDLELDTIERLHGEALKHVQHYQPDEAASLLAKAAFLVHALPADLAGYLARFDARGLPKSAP